MKVDNTIIHLDGLQAYLWMMIAILVFFIVLVLFDLREPDRKSRTHQQKKAFVKLVFGVFFALGAVGFYANVSINPKIEVSEGVLVRRVTEFISCKYYFDIGEPMQDKVLLSTFSASKIVPPGGLSVGSRYRYYCEGRTGELLGIERIAGE